MRDKAGTPVLWPPHAKSWLIGKDSDAGRNWGQEEKGTTEDEIARWHPWLDGREFEWTPGVCDGQGGLACFNSWGCKESDKTDRLNWTELNTHTHYPSWLVFTDTLLNCFWGLFIIRIIQHLEWESLNHGRVNLLNTYEWIFWRNYSLNLPGALKL